MAERAEADGGGVEILAGTYSPPRSRDSCAAYLACTAPDELVLDSGFATQRWRRDETALSPRLWDGRRCIAFPDGGRFHPDSAERAAALFARTRQRGMAAGISRRSLLIAGILFGGGLLWSAAFLVALPAISERLADLFPDELTASLDLEGQRFFSSGFLPPSRLDSARKEHLKRLFSDMTAPWAGQFHFDLLLRAGGPLGPNAFSLPAGTIICTDELVLLTDGDAELTAVLAHEIGHVVRRHALRQLIQKETLSMMVRALTGRVWKSDSLATAVPTLLVRTGYGRAFELEADRFSRDYLIARKMDPATFGRVLRKISPKDADSPIPSFLTTHPPTEERIARLR